MTCEELHEKIEKIMKCFRAEGRPCRAFECVFQLRLLIKVYSLGCVGAVVTALIKVRRYISETTSHRREDIAISQGGYFTTTERRQKIIQRVNP